LSGPSQIGYCCNPHQYVSMRIATEAGIAPAIHYIDEAARILVIDFVEQQPLKTYPGGRARGGRLWLASSLANS
jgi:hypothetical protein